MRNKRINFGGQEVKGQGHTTKILDLEASIRAVRSSRKQARKHLRLSSKLSKQRIHLYQAETAAVRSPKESTDAGRLQKLIIIIDRLL